MAPAVLVAPRGPAHKMLLMGTTSVAYVLCRIEDDSSLTPVSQHEDILTAIAAGGYTVEVEDLEFAYALYACDPSNGQTTTLTSFWHEIVATTRGGGSYEERTCSRCFEGRVYDMERGAWVACERCSGSGLVMVYLYPKLKRRQR